MKTHFLILASILFLLTHSQVAVGQENSGKGYSAPQILHAPQPVYPAEAKAAGLAGQVSVRIQLDEAGKVVSVDNPNWPWRACDTESFAPVDALFQSIVEAIKKAEFAPATKDGHPVAATTWISTGFLRPQTAKEDKPDTTDAGRNNLVKGKTKKMPLPVYPPAARAVRATGTVLVRVSSDENGRVRVVQAVNGNPLLLPAAELAACKATFYPAMIDGKPVAGSGFLTYNFSP